MSTSTVTTAVAAAVRAELARAQISAKRLGELTGRDSSYWSRRLNGSRALSLTDLELVSQHTGVPIEQLVAA